MSQTDHIPFLLRVMERLEQWPTERYARRIKSRLSQCEWQELVGLARAAIRADPLLKKSASDPNFRTNMPQLKAFHDALDPEQILGNMMIAPYRRAALRFAAKGLGGRLEDVPIITIPHFYFNGYARKFLCSDRRFVAVPFGVFFAISAVARACYELHEADSRRDAKTVYRHANSLLFIAANINKPSAIVAYFAQKAFGQLSWLTVAKPAHFAHVMGAFLVLHELSHVALNHRLSGYSDDLTVDQRKEFRDQELQADHLAMRLVLRAAKRNPIRWNDVRELHMFIVCNLFLVFAANLAAENMGAEGYHPSPLIRCRSLLDGFDAPARVRNSISRTMELLDQVGATRP